MAYQRKSGDKITFWKVNHTSNDFSDSDLETLIEKRIIVANKKSKLTSMKRGDYFYLVHGGLKIKTQMDVKLIGRIADDYIEPCSIKVNWFQRHYKILFPTNEVPIQGKIYDSEEKGYDFLNFIQVNSSIEEISQYYEYALEKYILQPLFNVNIKIFAGLWSEETIYPIPLLEAPKKIFHLNMIFYGVPGTGKTFSTTSYAVAICNNKNLDDNPNYDEIKQEYDKFKAEGRIKFVTFHQSYGYEDFIEGIKPLVDERGNITYKVTAGVFKEFCDTARARRNVNFVFIIDEINRGNVSKIFGELITLIEDDKRGELSATLPYSQEEFTVPQNVYLIGTMNTADRSIALLDTALRRRFSFVEMMPRPELLSDNIDGVNLQKLLDTLNTRIETHLDREHTIGHAYFINCKTIADIAAAFRNKIIPLLQEYFFDDYAQIQEVLGKKIITLTSRYTVNDKALLDAETYSL